jgi:GT2 family glycosyltransferase
MAASLSVSVVTFDADWPLVRNTLGSLAAALTYAIGKRSLGLARVQLVDNGPGRHAVEELRTMAQLFAPPLEAAVLSGHGNIGYGRSHNLSLLASAADYHLVLNPDVTMAEDAIHEALLYMVAHSEVAILAPEVRDASGEIQYLCKRYPSVLDLLLRGFAPAGMKRLFRERLERYEMRDLARGAPALGVPIVSGCFMFCRRTPLAAIGGFSEDFFLYLEDFDLSLRAATRGELAFVPAVRIVHYGGNAARKGPRHIALFARSMVTFFNRHGWKWV